MPAAPPDLEIPPPPPPQLLVELPSRPVVFFGNLRDLAVPRRQPALELSSTPGEFWPDVFVKRSLPWTGFLQSGGYHLIACAVLLGLTRLFAMHPRVVAKPAFDHSQVVYYDASEYLPPLDTLTAPAPPPQRADPERAPQPIISVPAEADNREQTIVTPPKVKLKRNVALPNIVAWSDTQRPQLEIPAAPLTPAADIRRMAPQLENSVVAPAPDAARLAHRRDSLALQSSVVAPPPDVRNANSPSAFQSLQPALIAPPPTVEGVSRRPVGDLNIGRSAVIAPAPQLAVAEQRTMRGGGRAAAAGVGTQVVPPPPSSASGSSFGSRGRVIALNLHPAVTAPPDPPAANRRGTFAAAPEGHPGASGSSGSASANTGTGTASRGAASASGNGTGSTRKPGDLPAGLYVGSAGTKASPVAGDPKNASPKPELVANARPPRVTSAPTRTAQPESASKLSEPERAVFGNRKFYSVTLNMPNLSSAGGSWVIRFAERQHASADPSAPAVDLSQPMPTRKVDPVYPIQLMRENVAGTVILYAVIHADGTVGDVRVLRSVDDRIDRFASDAIAQWKFEPATKNGAPVDVEATFQIPFKPAKVGTNF